jgi:uncharacterized protein YecT (DUF1311 family)
MSWHSRIFLLAFFTFATGKVARTQCEDAKSTLQINECFAKELKKADSEVNRIYHITVKKLQADDAALLRKRSAHGSLTGMRSARQSMLSGVGAQAAQRRG